MKNIIVFTKARIEVTSFIEQKSRVCTRQLIKRAREGGGALSPVRMKVALAEAGGAARRGGVPDLLLLT